jgi:hypothetical protein
MPLAILLLSSTIVMAASDPMLPPAAYAISFGATKNLSNNDGDSLDPRIEASGDNVYTVWSDSSEEDADLLFKRSATSGDSFQSTKDLSNAKDGDAQDQRIVKEGNNVYVVWSEDGDIFFKRSTNNGQSFGSTINLSNDNHFSHVPQIAATGNNVYIVWDDVTIVNGVDESQLLFKRSTDGGANFGSVKEITDKIETIRPRIAAEGNYVYVAFNAGSEDNQQIFFTRSTNGGNSFSEVKSINKNNENSVIGDIEAVGKNVYITWEDDSSPDGIAHAFFIRSTSNGQSFGNIRDLGLSDSSPQIDTTSSNVYLVWTNDDGKIVFKASKNNGYSFGVTKILSSSSNEPSINPQISSLGSAVRVVWEGNSDGPSDVFFRASGNEGDSFGSAKNLSDNSGDSIDPQIISSKSSVYVIWSDNTPGNYDTLFKKGVD